VKATKDLVVFFINIMGDKVIDKVNMQGIEYTQFERKDGTTYWRQTYPL